MVAADGQASNGASQLQSPEHLQHSHRVPAYAAWFRFDRLHTQEVRGVPEFFKGPMPTKSPRVSPSLAAPLSISLRAPHIAVLQQSVQTISDRELCSTNLLPQGCMPATCSCDLCHARQALL